MRPEMLPSAPRFFMLHPLHNAVQRGIYRAGFLSASAINANENERAKNQLPGN